MAGHIRWERIVNRSDLTRCPSLGSSQGAPIVFRRYRDVVRFGKRWMRRLVLLALCLAVAVAPAAAQQLARTAMPPAPALPSKPYQAVAVTLPPAADDASLETFRKELADVAKARMYGELARLVMLQGFFWDRDYSGGFDRKRPAVDNLAAAVRLEHRNGMGWIMLSAFAAETTAAPFTGRPGIICAPAEPSFDSVEFDRLTDETRSSARDWATPRGDKTAVRAAPQTNAAVIDTLGLALVRVLGYLAKDKEPDTLRTAWARVATPAGKIGFVAPGALMSLSSERLCYGKDGFGRWRIAGFVGADY